MEIGVITLGELLSDPKVGHRISPGQRLKEILDAAQLADDAGLDVFGVGEHHRLDFVVSAVPVVLAAIARKTRPQQIIDKLLYQRELFGHERFLAQVDLGGMPFSMVARTIELLATDVAPVVRREAATGRIPSGRKGRESAGQ